MPGNEGEQKTRPDGTIHRKHWLVDPNRGLVLPISGIWILALDWFLFSSNALSAGIATAAVMVIGFLLGGGGVLAVQKWLAGDGLFKAAAKGVAAGIAIGVPTPLAGTLVGGWVLLASGLKGRDRRLRDE